MPTISPGARPSPTRFSATLANPKMAGAGVKAGANRVSMASGRSFAYTPPVPRTTNPPLPAGAMPKPPAPFGKRLAYKTEPSPSLTIATRLVPQEHAPSEIVKPDGADWPDRKSTRLNSSHLGSSYAVFFLKKIIKSGTNTLHGSVFDHLGHDVLNAGAFFLATRTPYRQNDVFFSLGGPVLIPHLSDRRTKSLF